MPFTRVGVLLLGASLASGCAFGTGAAVTAPAVKPGKPALDLGGMSLAAAAPLNEHGKTNSPPPARPVMKASAGASAESSDPQLAAALRPVSTNPSALNDLRVAREYLRLGILDTAFTYANRAVEQKPRLAEAHELMARIWRDWGLPELGIAAASRATYFDRASAPAENTLGTLLDALGQAAEARHAFVRAVALDANAGWAMNNLCFVELRMDRLVEARSHCEAALNLDPKLIAAHNNLALTFVAVGDAPAARLAFLAAGDPAGASYNRGIVHLARREYVQAAAAFEEAIVARPMFSAAKARAHEARMLTLTAAHD